ncbi:hypothetical protein RND81_08G119400 [Saponaria officinalis]|uniref:TTF-type domain-containing protein n=1 Tax=Saponaria officinalis TaxID=3572 RepID=A0AAW1J6E6_SAPOF
MSTRVRKHESGAEKRKKKKRIEELTKSQRGALDKFFCDVSNENDGEIEISHVEETTYNNNVDVSLSDGETNECPNHGDTFSFDIFDPRNWDALTSKMIDVLVEQGPKRDIPSDIDPKDNYVLSNGEKCDRDWLIYSKKLDKVFCFCCKVFSKFRRGSLITDDFNDWIHLSQRLQEHEKSAEHIKNMANWYDLRLRLKTNQTIDNVNQKQISKERDHWNKVLLRIISIVKFLAKNNLAFRGSNLRLYQGNNENFMGLVEMIAEFDPIVQEHVRRIANDEIHFHYLGPSIQNELILLLASRIKTEIIRKINEAKYFSVILDCTPDTCHQEQMSMILRYVDVSSEFGSIEESFLGFLNVDDTTGQGLFDVLQGELNNLGLNIDDGKHQGFQKKLLDINPRAFYMPCDCHSLNLALCDMANTCGLTLKSLSVTRWESRIDSVKAIRFQVGDIREALFEVAEKDNDSKIRSEAKSLAMNELGDFEFLVSIVIWFEMIYHVNLVSKNLQSREMVIDVAIEEIKGLITFFEKYRESGFVDAIEEAKKIAQEINISPIFPQRREIRRKRQFDENRDDLSEVSNQSPEEMFRVNFFLYIVDQAISSLKLRFEQYKDFENIFGFLFTSKKINLLDDERLKLSCTCLEGVLKKGEHFDIDGDELYMELKVKLTTPVTVASAERTLIAIENGFLEQMDYKDVIDEFASKTARRMALFK